MNRIIHMTLFFLISYGFRAQGQGWSWVKNSLGYGQDWPSTIVPDGYGNIIEAGYFSSSNIGFGSHTLDLTSGSASGSFDIYLVKYDSAGNVKWAQSGGGTSDDYCFSATVDGIGNSYITGTFTSTALHFGATTLSNSGPFGDLFLAKYDSSGNLKWAKSFIGTGDEGAWSITCDASGYLYVTGYFDIPGFTLGTDILSTGGTFVAKFDSSGNPIWARDAVSGNSEAYTICHDSKMNLIIAGRTMSDVTFGSVLIPNEGGDDLFIVKYDSSGNVKWAEGAGGSGDEYVRAVCVDADDNIFLGGQFGSATLTLGTQIIIDSGTSNAFIFKCDTTGNAQWAKRIGGTTVTSTEGLICDHYGSVYATGYFEDPVVAIDTFSVSGDGNVFIAKYGSSGQTLWAFAPSIPIPQAEAYSVTIDEANNLYVAGNFSSPSISFDSQTVSNSGSFDIFLAKYDPTPTSVPIIKKINGIVDVFPVPCEETLNLRLNQTDEISSIEIVDLSGRILRTFYPAMSNRQNNQTLSLQLKDLSNGTYLLKTKYTSSIETVPFTVFH